MANQYILAFGLWLAAASVVYGQQERMSADRAFLGGGASAVLQPEQSRFGGGYFCCDAGGMAAGFWGEAGWFVSPHVSVRSEFSVPLAFTDDLTAPRFVQQNRHRDLIASGVVAFHPGRLGRASPALLAGFGAAFGRTTRASRLLTFAPGQPPFASGEPSVYETNETVPALTIGIDLPINVAAHVRFVPQLRTRVLWRSDEARFQDGLARWLVEPRVGIQVSF